MGFVGGDRPEQAYLLPPDVRDWLPPGHLAWALLDLAGQLDLTAFTAWYRADGQGRPAYHPKMMVTLICYCYCKGIRSSRAVEAATFDDLGARVICGNLHPDHSTAARFITRHEQAVKGLLAASVAACAREGLVTVDVVAGDGTKIRANASMTRNVTAADLNAQIAGLEELVAAEVGTWIAQTLAEVADQDNRDQDGGHQDGGDGPADQDGGDGPADQDGGDGPADQDGGDGPADQDGGDGPAGGGRAAPVRAGKRAAATLARRRQARDRLAAQEQARLEQAGAERAEDIARLEQRAARAGASAAALAAAADAKVAAWQDRAAAKAAAGSARGPGGPAPAGAGSNVHVRQARQAAARAQARLDQARAAPADPGKPGKINTTDPSSKVMPAKNGGCRQLHNVQVLAGKRQVIYAILRHPSPVDVAALHPLLGQGRVTLDAAGITARLARILFDTGYASDANFTAPCEGDLYVAVTREARQTGRLRDGRQPETKKASRKQMAAKLATDEGKALYKQRAGIIEPVFAQLFARLGTWLNYRDDKADLELHLWAATHNMLKATRARPRHPAPATA
jgi:transposase